MNIKSFLLTLAVWCSAAAVSFAQNPRMGTWKLDEAKSNIPPGSIKLTKTVVEAQGDMIKITNDGLGNDGTRYHSEWIGKFDGKEYPVTGQAATTMRSYKQVDDRTLVATGTKNGKVTQTARVVVAPDGKTTTLTLQSTDAAGKKVTATEVFDKQ